MQKQFTNLRREIMQRNQTMQKCKETKICKNATNLKIAKKCKEIKR